MMSLQIRYFASLREHLGRSGESLRVAPGTRAGELLERLGREYQLSPDLLIAVNREYVSGEQVLCDGDEVAFFPPVTGG